MRFGGIETPHRTLVIAEVGNNHEGSFAVAEELVGRAAEAGVDAVKFQTFRSDRYVSSSQVERLARIRRFELTYEQFRALSLQAKSAGLLFISTPFDVESAEFLGTICDIVKVASGDNDFYPLLEVAARLGKPLVISTGLAHETDVAYAKALVNRVWAECRIDGALALLHCVSAYPVPTAEANLDAIRRMEQLFADPRCTIGYSDHVLGNRASVLAVAAGARIIEKHFTLDRNYSDFRDHQLSADPEMLRQLVAEIREVEELLGGGAKTPQPCETEGATASRRSIGITRDATAGTVLTAADVTWLRPGTGLRPGKEAFVLGRRLRRNVRAGSLLSLEDLE